jgi:peptide/nickel transport system permease protein
MGRWIVNGILARNFPVVQAGVLVFALIFVFVNLIIDILYAWIDPRIQYT